MYSLILKKQSWGMNTLRNMDKIKAMIDFFFAQKYDWEDMYYKMLHW